jgi:hypothetical protein
MIGKWLNAGVLEGVDLTHPDEGTPQGGVISPLLANIFLHDVFDEWFVRDVVPALSGRPSPVRFADDIGVVFEREQDARRFLAVLPKRFGRFGLTLHPDKTRLVHFRKPNDADNGDDRPGTFDFLGFTNYWARSRRGWWVVKRKTARDRFSRALHRLRAWCGLHRHDPLDAQHRALAKKLNGHDAYYGITANFDALARFCYEATLSWWKALRRRSQRRLPWSKMHRILKRFPLPPPRIVHRYVT